MQRSGAAGWRSLVLGTDATGAEEREADRAERAVRATEVRGVANRPSAGPLTSEERAFYEDQLEANLGDVRIHAGRGARASAEALGAEAYAFANHAVFRDSAPAPHLLAHELTHVLQQDDSPRLMRKVRFQPESKKGASDEALAFFADIGLASSKYEFTSFAGGRASVEARGSRPGDRSAEIGWAYLKSVDLYERKTRKMRQDLAERNALISNARTVGPGLNWGKITKGRGKVNSTYWEIVRGKSGIAMRTLEEADPVKAIDNVKSNPNDYSVECFSSVALIEMLTERQRMGAEKFRQHYPRLVIHFTTSGGVLTSLDMQGLTEWDVGSNDNLDELIPGDQSNWKNAATGFNENFIYLGRGEYFAHPAGVVGGKAAFVSSFAEAGAAADLYMTQYRYRWSRWLPP